MEEEQILVNKDIKTNENSSFAGDVLKLASGTTIAQILGVLLSPLLTRFFSPNSFGVAAVFTSITSIIGVMVCLRYELAIMLPEEDSDAVNLLGVTFLSAVIISVITFIVFILGGNRLLEWINAPEIQPFIWLIPVTVFLYGLQLILNYWFTRRKNFGKLSITGIIQSGGANASKIGLGITGENTGGALIGATIAGRFLSTFYLLFNFWKIDKKLLRKHLNTNRMVGVARRYRKFPKYFIWAAILNAISWQLPVILLSKYFSSVEVGYYSLGFRVIQLPMSFLGNAIGKVFYQRSAEAYQIGKLKSIVVTTFNQLVKFGLFPTILLSIVGSDIFSFVFGIEWSEAGLYAQILAIWSFVWFVSSPLSTLNSLLEKQEFSLWFNILKFVSRLLSLVVGGITGNLILGLVLFTISGIFVYGYLNLWLMELVGVSWRNVLGTILENIFQYSPILIIMIFLKYIDLGTFWIITSAFLSLVIHLIFIWRDVPQIKQFLLDLLSSKL